MIENTTFEVSSKEFGTFLKAVENINNNGVKVKVHKDYLEAITMTDDNSSVILYARIVIINSEDIPQEIEGETINVKDFKKFKLMLGMNTEDTFRFTVKRNAVYFKNDKIRSAKFTLGEHMMDVKGKITAEWFSEFPRTMKMKATRQEISQIVSLSKFTSNDADKVYFTSDDDGNLIADVNNYSISNTDNVSVVVGKADEGKINDNVIVKVKSLELLTFGGDNILIESVNIAPKPKMREVLIISYVDSNVEVHYLLNSLIS